MTKKMGKELFKTLLINFLESNGYSVEERQVFKSNYTYTGLCCSKKSEPALQKILDFEKIYEAYSKKTFEQVMTDALKSLEYSDINTEESNAIISKLNDWEYVKSNLFITAIRKTDNEVYLENKVYQTAEDIAFVVKIKMFESNGIASVAVEDSFLKKYNVSSEEIFDLAVENSARIFPVQLLSFHDTIVRGIKEEMEMNGMYMPEEELRHMIPKVPCLDFILTNKNRLNGAAVIRYEDVLNNLHKTIGDFYIIPSSVHEVLISRCLPENNPEALVQVVKEVNQMDSAIAEKDVLTDSIYKFDGTFKKIL